jgi:diacylglycerol kinase family enzyme
VKYLGGVMLNRLSGMQGVSVTRADCVRISQPKNGRAYVQIDGEHVGNLPAVVRIVPNALTLLVPPEYGT